MESPPNPNPDLNPRPTRSEVDPPSGQLTSELVGDTNITISRGGLTGVTELDDLIMTYAAPYTPAWMAYYRDGAIGEWGEDAENLYWWRRMCMASGTNWLRPGGAITRYDKDIDYEVVAWNVLPFLSTILGAVILSADSDPQVGAEELNEDPGDPTFAKVRIYCGQDDMSMAVSIRDRLARPYVYCDPSMPDDGSEGIMWPHPRASRIVHPPQPTYITIPSNTPCHTNHTGFVLALSSLVSTCVRHPSLGLDLIRWMSDTIAVEVANRKYHNPLLGTHPGDPLQLFRQTLLEAILTKCCIREHSVLAPDDEAWAPGSSPYVEMLRTLIESEPRIRMTTILHDDRTGEVRGRILRRIDGTTVGVRRLGDILRGDVHEYVQALLYDEIPAEDDETRSPFAPDRVIDWSRGVSDHDTHTVCKCAERAVIMTMARKQPRKVLAATLKALEDEVAKKSSVGDIMTTVIQAVIIPQEIGTPIGYADWLWIMEEAIMLGSYDGIEWASSVARKNAALSEVGRSRPDAAILLMLASDMADPTVMKTILDGYPYVHHDVVGTAINLLRERYKGYMALLGCRDSNVPVPLSPWARQSLRTLRTAEADRRSVIPPPEPTTSEHVGQMLLGFADGMQAAWDARAR